MWALSVGVPGLENNQLVFSVIGPDIQCLEDELRAIVHLDAFGGSAFLGDML